jgi:Tfp pilus assembly protein PilE
MVVIIIAILASIALPQYLRTAERSRAGEALTLLSSIRSSQMRFRAQNPAGLYATQAQVCQLDIDVPGSLCAGDPGASAMFTYDVGTDGVHAIATRITTADTVLINLQNGATCAGTAAAADIYGVGAPGC